MESDLTHGKASDETLSPANMCHTLKYCGYATLQCFGEQKSGPGGQNPGGCIKKPLCDLLHMNNPARILHLKCMILRSLSPPVLTCYVVPNTEN